MQTYNFFQSSQLLSVDYFGETGYIYIYNTQRQRSDTPVAVSIASCFPQLYCSCFSCCSYCPSFLCYPYSPSFPCCPYCPSFPCCPYSPSFPATHTARASPAAPTAPISFYFAAASSDCAVIGEWSVQSNWSNWLTFGWRQTEKIEELRLDPRVQFDQFTTAGHVLVARVRLSRGNKYVALQSW